MIMSNYDLLPADHAYRLLCEKGVQFDEVTGATEPLPGFTYQHPSKGSVQIAANDRVLRATGRVYVGDAELREALRARGARTASLKLAVDRIQSMCLRTGVIWGVSGFATPGPDCSAEAGGLAALYQFLADMQMLPMLVADGGASVGVLGLNGLIAAMHKVPTLGFSPLQGIASMGARDHTVIWGDTFRDREQLVGLLPDALVCAGGGDGAGRECEKALDHGSPVLLLALRDYDEGTLPVTYRSWPKLAEAEGNGRLVVCRSLDELPRCIGLVHEMARLAAVQRPARLWAMAQLLSR